MSKTLEQLDAEFAAAAEADDSELAGKLLKQIETFGEEPVVSAEAIGLEPTVAKEATQMDAPESITITKADLGMGDFKSPLAQLTDEQIDSYIVKVESTEDKIALILPGVSIIDAEHALHIQKRPDVKRAARGLALAAAGGVDTDSQVITGASGRVYTIVEGECFEVQQTPQLNWDGSANPIVKHVPCRSHLEYRKNPGKGFTATGGQHLRGKHQWALMYAFGYFITCSQKTFDEEGNSVVRTEIGASVGTDSVRKAAQAQFAQWTQNRESNNEVRTAFAQATNARKNELGLEPGSYLPPQNEIGGFDLPTGETVSEAIVSLQGRQFALLVRVPVDERGKIIEIATRTCKNLAELASAVAPHFALARKNNGKLLALELQAR